MNPRKVSQNIIYNQIQNSNQKLNPIKSNIKEFLRPVLHAKNPVYSHVQKVVFKNSAIESKILNPSKSILNLE
jgi:hypothetical protein